MVCVGIMKKKRKIVSPSYDPLISKIILATLDEDDFASTKINKKYENSIKECSVKLKLLLSYLFLLSDYEISFKVKYDKCTTPVKCSMSKTWSPPPSSSYIDNLHFIIGSLCWLP